MSKEELLNIKGGVKTSISATMLNSIIRGVALIFDLGRSLGSSARRSRSGMYC